MYLVFKLNGALYDATIWITTQSWTTYIITECTIIMENM